MLEFRKQKEFPYYKEYQKKFPITKETIFVYSPYVYSDYEIPADIIYHELKHIDRQNEIGRDIWIKKYLEDKDFRLEEELLAYRYQLQKVKEYGSKTDLMNITTECVTNISSKLYGEMISYREAEKLLKIV